MKISLKTIPHISSKIAIDLNKSGVVTMTMGLERVSQEAQKVLEESVTQELALEDKVHLKFYVKYQNSALHNLK